MDPEDRQSYLRRRALEVRALSEQASDLRVRAVHLELAIRYELLAAGNAAYRAEGDHADA